MIWILRYDVLRMVMAERKYFAAGDYLTRFSPASEFDLQIDSPFPKPGWNARSTSPSGIFPGTAILWEGAYYEVRKIHYVTGPPTRVLYSLKIWEDRFPIRTQYHYTTAEAEKLASMRHETMRSNRLRILLHLFSPFIGMIPGDMQTTLANRYGSSPVSWTFLSALMILLPSGFAVIFMAAAIFKSPLPGPPSLHFLYPLGFYFFLESVLRMFHCTRQDEPIGSLPVALPFLLARRIRDKLSPAYQEKQMRRMQAGKRNTDIFLQPDTVRHGSGESYDLEVVSILPKEHWNVYTGIQYQNQFFGMVESKKTGAGKDTRYKYYLKKVSENAFFRNIYSYSPDEVRDIYMQMRRRDLGTWVDTFSPLWGLLDGTDQKRLSDLYGFDALKYTRWTVWILGILAGANLSVSLINLLSGIHTPVDILLLFPSTYFLIESRTRWEKAKKGEPQGSILSILIRPLASRLLA